MHELLEKAREMAIHFVSTAIDCAFLVLWALANLLVEHVIEKGQLTGIDLIIYRSMQLLFGLVTLAPICIWLRRDLAIMMIRAKAKVAEETRRVETNGEK